jgi:hypothetical protein
MKPSGTVVGPPPGEQAQQDVEDMRAELLHDLRDGDEAEDDLVEVVSSLVARLHRGPARQVRARRTIPATKN